MARFGSARGSRGPLAPGTARSRGTDPDADTTLFATHNENVKLGGDIFVRNIKMVADLIKKFAE